MKFIHYFIVAICLVSLAACQSENNAFSWFSSESLSQTCGLTLQSIRPSFSDEVISTRLSDGNWEEGDQVYIRFSSSSYGVGTYTNGDWDFSYKGKLSNISEATCSVYFLKGDNVIVNNATISFDPKTAIYGTTTAFYSYSSSSNWLTVGGTLSPMTSRIRFSGTSGTDFDLQHGSGLVFYNQLNVSDNTFSQQTGMLHETIHEDGYSDYLYLSLDSDTELSLNVDDANFSGKKILKSQLSNGVSGVISLPTKSNHNGWTMAKKQFEDKYTIGNTDYSSGWLSAFSKTYVIPEGDEWHAHFNLHINPQATNTYKNFAIFITTDADRGVYGYEEYGAIRFDNQPTGNSEWGFIDRNLVESTLTFNTDTDSGIEKLGGEIELTVDRSNNHFYIEITNGKVTKTYKQNNPLPNHNSDQNNTNIRVYLVPEGSYIDFISTDVVPLEPISDGAFLVDGGTFNKAIKALANGREMDYWEDDEMIKEIRVECNSMTSTGTLVSSSWSKYPIYANYDNGVIVISSQDKKIKTIDMEHMFSGCSSLSSLDLSSFDTQNVTDMSGMFSGCSSLSSLDLSNFDTQNVTDMLGMFTYCSSLSSLDLSNFDTQNVTDMLGMFTYCSSLSSLDLSNFDTQNVTEMSSMFFYCTSLSSLDLSSFDTQNVTRMSAMFNGCSSLSSLDLSNFDTHNVTEMYDMFNGCSSLLSLDLSNFNTQNVTDMYAMFSSCSSLSSLDLSNFDTRNVTEMYVMFSNCYSLSSLDLSNFDTRNVNRMLGMFNYCSSLSSLDLSNFDTQNVTDMRHMFLGCSSLSSLDLSSFDTQNVTNMSSMFNDCNSLTSLDLSNFDTQNVTDMSYMFYYCRGLYSLKLGESFVINNTTNTIEMADRIALNSGYCTISCLSDVKRKIENNIFNTDATLSWDILDSTKEVLDFVSSYTWNGGIREGNVVTFFTAWDGLAWWMEYRTDIAKIVVEFEEPTTMDTQILVLCSDIYGYSNLSRAGSMKLEIELPQCTVEQIAIQNELPGTIKIKSVTVYSESINAY